MSESSDDEPVKLERTSKGTPSNDIKDLKDKKTVVLSQSESGVVINVDDTEVTLHKKGQLRPTPSPGSADRVFYETLYHENPNSFMALKWCIEYGIFSDEELKKIYPKFLVRKEKEKERKKRHVETSVKTASTKKSKTSSSKEGGVTSEDVGLSIGSGWENQNSSGI